MEIVSKVIKIECKKPTLDFIEDYFKSQNLEPVRWAIVKVEEDILTLDCAFLV